MRATSWPQLRPSRLLLLLSLFLSFAGSEKMFQGSKLANYSTTKQLPTQTNRQRLIHKAKMKSLRISVVIIIAFLICWTPYYVMMIIFLFWNPDKRASMPGVGWTQVGVGFGFKLGRIGVSAVRVEDCYFPPAFR